jgi:hypothetical protein
MTKATADACCQKEPRTATHVRSAHSRLASADKPEDERDDEQDERDPEEHPSAVHRRAGDAAEAKQRRDDGDERKTTAQCRRFPKFMISTPLFRSDRQTPKRA